MTHIRPLEAGLSPAQLRVLAAVAAGGTAADTGRAVGISEHTVKVHLTAIRLTLGALNTVHAVALMDDHSPGWRAPLPIPARPSEFPDPGASGFATGAGASADELDELRRRIEALEGFISARPSSIPARLSLAVGPESGQRRAGSH